MTVQAKSLLDGPFHSPMLKKIPIGQLQVGMYLHALEGPWIDHPFWRSRFVVHSTADLRLLHDSAVDEVWIDTSQGLNVAAAADVADAAVAADDETAAPVPAATAATAATARVEAAIPVPAVRADAAAASRSLQDELQQAAAICKRGRASVLSMFSEARLGHTVHAEDCLPLVEEISASVQRNPAALISLARLKTKDDYSFMHSVAVCALMVSMARQLGWDAAACRAAGLAGMVHDVGKAVMPPALLNKPGRLTEAEFDIIRSHPERGRALLTEGRGATPQMLDVVLHHHEKMDGSGYPEKLSGKAISLIARMGAICDVYDAVTSNRPYKHGWDPAESIARMAGWKGHFDTALFGAFVKGLGIYPTGSLLRLESGRLAVVVEQNASALVSPIVKVFFSTRSNMPIPVQLLDLSRPDCHDRIVGREPDPELRFPHLNELWADPAALRKARR